MRITRTYFTTLASWLSLGKVESSLELKEEISVFLELVGKSD